MTFKSLLKAPNFPKTELRDAGTETGNSYRCVNTQCKACTNFLMLKNKSIYGDVARQARGVKDENPSEHWKAKDSDATWSDLMFPRQGQLAVSLLGQIVQNYFAFQGLVSSPGKKWNTVPWCLQGSLAVAKFYDSQITNLPVQVTQPSTINNKLKPEDLIRRTASAAKGRSWKINPMWYRAGLDQKEEPWQAPGRGQWKINTGVKIWAQGDSSQRKKKSIPGASPGAYTKMQFSRLHLY